jgi:hypothetical protein
VALVVASNGSEVPIRAANERRNVAMAQRGEAVSIEMQELQRAYAQFGHLR